MMDAALRGVVRERASRRCEYCRLHEDDSDFLSFHVEHIVPKQHGGTDDPEILCYACSECNWAKGPNLSGMLNGKIYPLFNPRRQNWTRHFYWDHTTLVGRTKTGMVTVQVLNINDPSRVMLRENLLFEGRFPPGE
jgi:hypothetical protein